MKCLDFDIVDPAILRIKQIQKDACKRVAKIELKESPLKQQNNFKPQNIMLTIKIVQTFSN